MKYLLIFILLFSYKAYSQVTPSIMWQNRCEFNTDGTGKSLSLKIKLSVPCLWELQDGERPHIVKKFSYGFGENIIMSALSIKKMPVKPSKKEIEETFSKEGLKELSKDLGKFISGRKLMVDGIVCGEVEYKMKREAPVATLYIQSIQYFFIYEDKIIILNYSVGSKSSEDATSLYNKYKQLFKGLAGSTVFISKWE